MRSLIVAAVLLAVSLSIIAADFTVNARCEKCGVNYDPRIQYHLNCVKNPSWRGVVKALSKTRLTPPVNQEEVLKRRQQLDAAYREKFPGQPEESYPKF